MSQELTSSEAEVRKLLKGWRWRYKGHPVGKWAEQNTIKWKEEKSCAS